MNFTTPLERLYAELDAARAAIVEVPSGALTALIERYDRAREQAQPRIVIANDPASVRAMCDALAPLYKALLDWERGLVIWMTRNDPDCGGPMAELSPSPFDTFFRAILSQKHPNNEELVRQTLFNIGVMGIDPWRIICAP